MSEELTHEDHYKGVVLGFMFSEDLDQVLLIKDSCGRLNGVTGRVIYGGSHLSAIWKIFEQETGYDHRDWSYLKSIKLESKEYQHIFYAIGDFSRCKFQSQSEIWNIGMKTKLITSEKTLDIAGGIKLELGAVELIQECHSKIYKPQDTV